MQKILSVSQNSNNIQQFIEGKKVGLVLSGGGMRGIAHIGVIKAMNDLGIEAEIITGTSMGALVGAMYAAGKTADEMLEAFANLSIFSFRNYTYKKPGLLDTMKFKKYFIDYFEEDSFEHLQRQLIVNSTNILTGKHKIFTERNLFDKLLSSIAYPGMFSPVEINGQLYADGGITNNFPIETIQWQCDVLIGSYVNPLRQIEKDRLKNSFSTIERVLQISMYTMEVDSFYIADVFIMPKQLSKFPLFSLKHIDAAFEMGYNEAIKQFEQFSQQKTTTE